MDMGSHSDGKIIGASLADPRCFTEVFDRHAGAVFRFIARRIGPERADGLVGEVFRIAFERRVDYHLDRPECLPWLYGIAANLIRSERRRATRGAGLLGRLGRPAVAWPGDDEVADRVDAGRQLPSVMAALGRLNSHEREVLLMVAWEELSYQQIAEALAIPVGTVRSRLHRGRRHLRAQLPDSDRFATELNPAEGWL
jgi:RNA polymerase sigma-70 factor (ECF subfamily)